MNGVYESDELMIKPWNILFSTRIIIFCMLNFTLKLLEKHSNYSMWKRYVCVERGSESKKSYWASFH